MKKLLALVLSLSLMFTLVPCCALAADADQSGYDTLVDKAASAFPEYAAKLLNPSYRPSVYTRNAAARVLVVSETRSISDKESITYTEYSDGLVLLSDYDFTYETTEVDYYTGSTYRSITIDIEAACVATGYSGYFYLNGVSYKLYDGYDNFDRITNPGTEHKGTNCISYHRDSYTQIESYTGYAGFEYTLGFRIGPKPEQFVTSKLYFYVGEDTADVSHVSW